MIRFGTAFRELPLLSGPVGPERLRGNHNRFNTPLDLALIDGCLEQLASLPQNDVSRAPDAQRLIAIAEAIRPYRTDRLGAIAAFQRVTDVRDDAERADNVVRPDGLTWQTLFTYGEIARGLVQLRNRRERPTDYVHAGNFREQEFTTELTRLFTADRVVGARLNASSLPNILDVLRRIVRDPRIIDIRWMAYMLATVMRETGRFVPIEEVGKGRVKANDIKDYYLPIKVAGETGGEALITEQDGDTFTVTPTGRITKGGVKAVRGADYRSKSAVYDRATGQERRYFGRGYCQLTWWDNYVKTGVEIGLGLELLFHPEKAMEPAIAYEAMAHCMIHGTGFANGKRFHMFFMGAYTDYVGARAMVNGTDHAIEIARTAVLFEQSLLAAKA